MESKVFEIIQREQERQNRNIELIASENFPSWNVRRATASCLTAKYAEGYPAKRYRDIGNAGRYYGGCQYVDEMEEYCCLMWRKAFACNDDDSYYHVNVQPHSGTQANMEAFAAVLKPGDTILSMSLDCGGHLSHGSKANFSGKLYQIVHYELDSNGYINMEDVRKKAMEYHPALILAGASAYPRVIDFKAFSDIARESGSLFMVDMAHIAGLIVAGDHPSPFGLADIITTTTHKTLRGTRGGLIFCRPELAKKIDSAVFPNNQGGPLEHVIAAKAATAEECCTEEYKQYIHQVVANTRAMCEEFIRNGFDVVSGGTDNHLFILDFSKSHPNLTGAEVQAVLDEHHITLNKNCVPNETKSPKVTSGVRIGLAAMTTKGWKEKQSINCARKIIRIINEMPQSK